MVVPAGKEDTGFRGWSTQIYTLAGWPKSLQMPGTADREVLVLLPQDRTYTYTFLAPWVPRRRTRPTRFGTFSAKWITVGNVSLLFAVDEAVFGSMPSRKVSLSFGPICDGGGRAKR